MGTMVLFASIGAAAGRGKALSLGTVKVLVINLGAVPTTCTCLEGSTASLMWGSSPEIIGRVVVKWGDLALRRVYYYLVWDHYIQRA